MQINNAEIIRATKDQYVACCINCGHVVRFDIKDGKESLSCGGCGKLITIEITGD